MSKAIQRVGIVGAGTMGTGIMINGVMHGIEVLLCERSSEVLAAAKDRLNTYLMRQIKKERLTDEEAKRTANRLTCSEDKGTLVNCDLVIEAVFENLALKQKIFAELEQIAGPSAILASNTSCLRLADIAGALEHQDRFCGMHYFSPAEINPVVELIEGPGTSPETLSAAANFLQTTGKEVIACKDQNGFALNRFFCPYTNEATRLLDEGVANAGQIDAVAKEAFGLALGPFAVMNIIGTATNLNAMRNLQPLGPFYTAAKGLITKGAENAPWIIEETPVLPGQAVIKTITARLTGAILLPVLETLQEDTATLEAIDRGAAKAFRFQKTPGILMKEQGEQAVQHLINQLAETHRHKPTNPI